MSEEAGAKAGRGAEDDEEDAPPEVVDEVGMGGKDSNDRCPAGRGRRGVGDRRNARMCAGGTGTGGIGEGFSGKRTPGHAEVTSALSSFEGLCSKVETRPR